MQKRYLITLIVLLFSVLSGVVLVNLIVDPLDVYRLVKKPGFNAYKSKLSTYTRLAKPIHIENRQPERLAFGSSRTEIGIPVYGTAWDATGGSAMNAAVSGGDITTVKRLFSHALQVAPVKDVVIGIDFFMFNGRSQQIYPYPQLLATDAEANERMIQGLVLTLFTPEMLRISTKTLRRQDPEDNKHLPTGQMNNVREISKAIEKGYLKGFERFEIGFTRGDWTKCKNNLFSYEGADVDTMEIFSDILQTAKANDIDITLFISPVHARLLETLDAAGLWDEFEQWKIDLVASVEGVNAGGTSSPILLWDFSGYHRYSEEPLPDGPGVAMDWYIDSSHYNDALGKVMLDIMYGGGKYDDNFAERLSKNNVKKRINLVKYNQKIYREKYTAQYEEFKVRADTYLKEKRKNGVDCPE